MGVEFLYLEALNLQAISMQFRENYSGTERNDYKNRIMNNPKNFVIKSMTVVFKRHTLFYKISEGVWGRFEQCIIFCSE